MATLREHFAANLKRLLQEAEITQRAFAKDVGVSEGIVSKWMNERVFPEDRQIDKICEVLKVPYEELVRDPLSPFPDPVMRFFRDVAKSRGYDVTLTRKR